MFFCLPPPCARTATHANRRASRGLRLRALGVIAGLTLIAACGSPTGSPTTDTALPPGTSTAAPVLPDAFPSSMKGYVLYGWTRTGRTWFALTRGTNRLKTFDELDAATPRLDGRWVCIRVEGEAAAADLLRRVPKGEFVAAEGVRHVSVAQNTVPDDVADPADDVLRRLDPTR